MAKINLDDFIEIPSDLMVCDGIRLDKISNFRFPEKNNRLSVFIQPVIPTAEGDKKVNYTYYYWGTGDKTFVYKFGDKYYMKRASFEGEKSAEESLSISEALDKLK